MVDSQSATERLIDAIPPYGAVTGNAFHVACPMAFDASTTLDKCFEAAALNPDVAEALDAGKTSVPFTVVKDVMREARFGGEERMYEYVGCLLRRARGECLYYDAEANRERTDTEIVAEALNRG
ncbi:MAG TPA: hypothetical protein VG604_00515 [Candidatus Saccharimonadales bacterium]|nr:hypothetical protein [Candidatus Saccharimonadales bacterium]